MSSQLLAVQITHLTKVIIRDINKLYHRSDSVKKGVFIQVLASSVKTRDPFPTRELGLADDQFVTRLTLPRITLVWVHVLMNEH